MTNRAVNRPCCSRRQFFRQSRVRHQSRVRQQSRVGYQSRVRDQSRVRQLKDCSAVYTTGTIDRTSQTRRLRVYALDWVCGPCRARIQHQLLPAAAAARVFRQLRHLRRVRVRGLPQQPVHGFVCDIQHLRARRPVRGHLLHPASHPAMQIANRLPTHCGASGPSRHLRRRIVRAARGGQAQLRRRQSLHN